MASIKASGGRTFSKTCVIRGREMEGRKAILVSKKENTRIAPIGPDGLTMDGSEKVATSEILDIQPVQEKATSANAPIPGVVGDRGTITIPSEIRRRLRLPAGSPILIDEQDGVILIQPAEIRPRGSDQTATLDELLSRVTPDNIHEEISTGETLGREIW